MVDGDAVGRAHGVLAAVALADGVLFVVGALEVELEAVHNLACLFGQSVFLDERHYGQFGGREGCGQVQHGARLAVFEFFFFKAVAHHREEHAVHADTCLDDIRRVALVAFGVEVFYFLARIFCVLRKVEIRAGVYAFHLFEAEGHVELDVGGGVGVVRQLFVVVEAIVFVAEAKGEMPVEARLLPFLEPVELRAGLYEKLHLHLFELAHAEDKLAGHDFVAEGLTDLCDAEGQAHAAGLLHVEVVHEDALRRFGTQVNGGGAVGRRAHFCFKHEVELAHVGPVARTGDGAHDFLVENDLLELFEVHVVHRLRVTLVQGVALGLVFEHAAVGGAKLRLVERLAEAFACLGYFFFNLLLVLADLILDEHVGAVALLRVAVVDEGVVEGIHVSACFPHGGVHENGSVDAHDVVVEQHHSLPPVLLDVVFQFHAVLSVVVDCAETVVNVARREYEPIFLAVRHDFLEYVFLCHVYI